MRLLLLMLLCLSVLACRRQPTQPVAMTPMPEPVESEPEPEPEPEPKPDPGPPKPTSEPPKAEAGFGFGWQQADVRKECTRNGKWGKDGKYFTCTQAADDPGFPGKPVLAFCSDKLCAIGIVHVPEQTDFESWRAAFKQAQDVLIERHGPPTTEVENFPEECQNETFAECVNAGKAQKELTWKWDDHLVRLSLSIKLTGEGPGAIRFVSMPQQAAGGGAEPTAAE